MRTGIITIGDTSVGFVEEEIIIDNQIMDASLDQGDIPPSVFGNSLSERAEGSDTGKADWGPRGHHHGLGHSRPSGGHERSHRNQHHFPGHTHHPAPGRHHHPGHDQRGDKPQQPQKPIGDIPYSKTGNPFDRARFDKELQEKPWLKEKMRKISLGENQDPHANLAVIETMMNRAVVRGTSLEQQVKRHRSSGLDEGGYYAGWAPHYSNDKSAMVDRNVAAALGHTGKGQSNISNYATDNSSGDLAAREIASGSFKHHMTLNRESFFSPGSAEPAHRDTWQRLNKKAQEYERTRDAADKTIDISTEPM